MRQLLYLPFTVHGIDVYINMQKDQTIELIDGSIQTTVLYSCNIGICLTSLSVADFVHKGVL